MLKTPGSACGPSMRSRVDFSGETKGQVNPNQQSLSPDVVYDIADSGELMMFEAAQGTFLGSFSDPVVNHSVPSWAPSLSSPIAPSMLPPAISSRATASMLSIYPKSPENRRQNR